MNEIQELQRILANFNKDCGIGVFPMNDPRDLYFVIEQVKKLTEKVEGIKKECT